MKTSKVKTKHQEACYNNKSPPFYRLNHNSTPHFCTLIPNIFNKTTWQPFLLVYYGDLVLLCKDQLSRRENVLFLFEYYLSLAQSNHGSLFDSTLWRFILASNWAASSSQTLWNVADRNAVNRSDTIPLFYTSERNVCSLSELLQHCAMQNTALYSAWATPVCVDAKKT